MDKATLATLRGGGGGGRRQPEYQHLLRVLSDFIPVLLIDDSTFRITVMRSGSNFANKYRKAPERLSKSLLVIRFK